MSDTCPPGQGEEYGACVDVVTLRLFATPGFPPAPGRPGPAHGRPWALPIRSGPSGLLTTAQRFSITPRLWATRSKPYDCGKTRPGPGRVPSGFPLRSRLSPLPMTAQRFPVTPRALRNGTLLTTPPEMPRPPAACFPVCVVRCAPAPGRSALLPKQTLRNP